MDVQHADDALELMRPSLTPVKKLSLSEVIHAVHVELARHEVVQEPFGVVVIEDLDGRVESPVERFVEARHDERADLLVVHAPDEAVLEAWLKGPWPTS